MYSPAGPRKSPCMGQENCFQGSPFIRSKEEAAKKSRQRGHNRRRELTSRLHEAIDRYGEGSRRHQPVFTLLYIFILTSTAILTTISTSNQLRDNQPETLHLPVTLLPVKLVSHHFEIPLPQNPPHRLSLLPGQTQKEESYCP